MKRKGEVQLSYGEGQEFGAVYARVSTPGQEEGSSLEFQQDKNLAMAKSKGVTIKKEHIIVEIWSGLDPNRAGIRTLRDLVNSGEIKHVFSYKPDRLYRDALHGANFIRLCRRRGVTLHFADGTTVESVLDELVQYLYGYVGQQEVDNIRTRTYDGKKKGAEDNRMPNGCGAGLYDYDYDTQTKKRTINVYEAQVVRQVYDWRLAGVSCCEIARRLNRKGIPSKRDGKWSAGTVRTMLRNEAYTGV